MFFPSRNPYDLSCLMRFFFLILTLTTTLSSTQPMWDTMCKALFNSCAITSCETSVCTTQEEEENEDRNSRQCCPSFQCCFLAFPGFSVPYSLDFKGLTIKKIRPSENTNMLRSSFIGQFFHPPDVAFFIT